METHVLSEQLILKRSAFGFGVEENEPSPTLHVLALICPLAAALKTCLWLFHGA